MPGGQAAAALESLLGRWDRDRSGRLDVGEVGRALELFASLEAAAGRGGGGPPQPPPPSPGPDGRAGREAVARKVAELAAGPPARPLAQLARALEDLAHLEQLFVLWTGSTAGRIDIPHSNDACALFNKWALRAHPGSQQGRMVMNYYDRGLFGSDINLGSFSRWLWEELRLLEEQFQVPSGPTLERLHLLVRFVRLFHLHDWSAFADVHVSELHGVLAACRGCTWARMSPADQAEAEGSLARSCGAAEAAQGKLDPQGLRKFLREEATALRELAQLEGIIAATEHFAAMRGAAQKVTASFKILDNSGTGVIKVGQMHSVLSKIYNFPPEEMDALVHGAGAVHDGDVDYDKFTKWILLARPT